jgi:hypothetical protein
LSASITSLQFTLDSYLVAGGYYTGTINFTEAQGSPVSFTSGTTSDAFISVLTVDNRLRDVINITGVGNQQVADVLLSGELTYACGLLDNESSPQQGSPVSIIPVNAGGEAFLFRYNENPTTVEAGFSKTNQIILFPNPANERVNLSVYAEFAEILDVSGRPVQAFVGNSSTINALPSGIYLLRIQLGGEVIFRPLIVSE